MDKAEDSQEGPLRVTYTAPVLKTYSSLGPVRSSEKSLNLNNKPGVVLQSSNARSWQTGGLPPDAEGTSLKQEDYHECRCIVTFRTAWTIE